MRKMRHSLSPDELINPVSTLSGKPAGKKSNQTLVPAVEQYEGWLRNWILERTPERLENKCIGPVQKLD
jgi:methionyl-tRNA synthetase